MSQLFYIVYSVHTYACTACADGWRVYQAAPEKSLRKLEYDVADVDESKFVIGELWCYWFLEVSPSVFHVYLVH